MILQPNLILGSEDDKLTFQRAKTLTAVDEQIIQAIIDFQQDYLLTGDVLFMKPMILKDIANISKFDISTVSRVVTSHNAQAHFGVFPLKSLFSESIMTKDNIKVSAWVVKQMAKSI
ncbi:hypothetical protein FACS189430_08230 [Bacteroidia bacterium]|nr:hypothetical protein FACS189430_08230 [Bacteroidia bacterium]